MESIVGAVRGTEKLSSFQTLLALTDFDKVLLQACRNSGKEKADLKIAVKPNMMVFVHQEDYPAVITDTELVECLVDHMWDKGYRDISVCEARNDVGRMLKNHTVRFVAQKIGYKLEGRYRVVDLTQEAVPFKYLYRSGREKTKHWKDSVGRTWRDAEFRISFAKCKTHEHDWMTLGVKNIYGCFPSPDKVCRYHIRNEIFDVTARSLLNFPVHFSFIDAWTGSDGFQGYKIAHPRHLGMLFGGSDVIAVDMEVFRRAGLNPRKSKMLNKAVEQLRGGVYPQSTVRGDRNTLFHDLCDWENISDDTVERIDVLEEVYISWGLINLRAAADFVDYDMFPPKNIFYRFLVWVTKKLHSVFKLSRLYKKIYRRRK